MKLNTCSTFVLLLIFSCTNSTSKSDYKTETSLCHHFYKKCSPKNPNIFWGLRINTRGVKEVGPKWLKAICNNIGIYSKDGKKCINMPIYEDIVDWKHFLDSKNAPYVKAYEDLRRKDGSSTLECFAFASEVMYSFYHLEVGHPYQCKGILGVDANPSRGKVIAFHITAESHVYFAPDYSLIKNQKVLASLRQMPKFDSAWHYCVGKDCP